MTNFDTIDNTPTIDGSEHEGKLLSDRYKVLRKLGEGGMGLVYLAEDMELGNTKVAIKFIPPMLAGNVRAIKNLKREAQTAMQLSHPNIVRLHDLHTDGHQKFLVMEYIEGKTLEESLAERDDDRFTLEELLPIAEQIAEGLDYAHSKSVLHRDLKPSNIMIAKDGTVRLLDFGIAREIKDSYTRVTGNETSGTLPYMSPEQLMGEHPSRAMDIYSFGAVLYECLCGHPPFYVGDIREQIRLRQAQPLSTVAESVNTLLLAVLSKDHTERPGKAIDLVSGLNGCPIPPQSPPASSAPVLQSTQSAVCPACQKPVQPEWKVCPFCQMLLTMDSCSDKINKQNQSDWRLFMNCSNCKKEVQSDWKSCPYCGAEIKQEKKCASCGKPLDLAWKVCPFCSKTVPEPDQQQDDSIKSDLEKTNNPVLGVKIKCPHCDEPLYHESNGMSVDCEECGRDFYTDTKGQPVGVKIECPHCEIPLYHEEKNNTVKCEECESEFSVGLDGKPVGSRIECPHCEVTSYFEETGLVDCPECSGEFTITENKKKQSKITQISTDKNAVSKTIRESTNPIIRPVGVTIDCPYCDWEIYHEKRFGSVKCSQCKGEFYIKEDGKPKGVKIDCPYCDWEIYHEQRLGFVKCSECKGEFSVNIDGNPVGTKIECPHCCNDFYCDIQLSYFSVNCPECRESFTVDKRGG